MPQRPGLGKGLDALIPSTPDSQQPASGEKSGVSQLPVDAIRRNPRQPRDKFDSKDLDELTASIREHGIIQPLIVSPEEAGKYTLIAGERRLEAAKKAGLRSVPAILREVSDRELLELALIENLQRADLNPLEEAQAYFQLTEDFGLSHEEVALRVGKSRPAVSNTLRLLQLSDTVKQALVASYVHEEEYDQDTEQRNSRFRLSEGHARALLHLSTHQAQDAALRKVEGRRLNVRQTEELVKNWGKDKESTTQKKTKSPEVVDLENRMLASLGQEVKLRYENGRGAITIRYNSDEELETLLERLL
jgi:ParB family chromosome partitioning protein